MIQRIFVPLLLFSFLFFSSFEHTFAEKPLLSSFDSQILSGIDAMYAMRFTEAQSTFDRVISENPKDPAGYFFRSTISFWKYIFDDNQQDFKRFLTESDQAISIAEAAIEQNLSAQKAKIYLGGVYGYRCVANVKAENYLKASWDGRNCYNYVNEIIKENPNEYDAYFSMGIFHFVFGILPHSAQMLTNIAGLKGDKERGIQELEIASQKSTFNRNDAKLLLGLINVYYKNDYDKGIPYLKDLLQKYPDNVPILYALGNMECQLKKVKNAAPYYRKVLEMQNVSFKTFTSYTNFRLGEVNFRLNDFEAAKKNMQAFVMLPIDKAFRAIGFFRLAESYELTGNREKAVQGYRRAIECQNSTPEDRYAVRKARHFLKNPMTEAEKMLIRGENFIESSQFAEGDQILWQLTGNTALPKEIQAESWYYLGESARMQKQYYQSLGMFQKVIEIKPEVEKWLLPWTYFHLSQSYYGMGDAAKSAINLEKARVFSDYDFQEWVAFQVERDVKTLK